MSPTPTPRSSAAFWARTIPGRSVVSSPELAVGRHRSLSKSVTARSTSISSSPGSRVPPSANPVSASATHGDPVTARTASLSTGAKSTPTVSCSGCSPTNSSSPRSMVATKESIIPMTPTSTAMAAPMPSAVRIVRRGPRTTLRTGSMATVEPGSGSRRTSGASPPETARCAVWMASTGATRTARRTGRAVATIGRRSPRAAPRRKTSGWNSKIQEGIGKKPRSRSAIRASMSSPTPTPNAAPRAATWTPTSRGRNAMRAGGTPRAMPMPISRRWASTMRTMRLNAAKAAPSRMRTANTS